MSSVTISFSLRRSAKLLSEPCVFGKLLVQIQLPLHLPELLDQDLSELGLGCLLTSSVTISFSVRMSLLSPL